jgi:hypothetical protein
MAVPAAAHVVAWVVLGSGVAASLVMQSDAAKRLAALEEARASAPAVAAGGDAPASATLGTPDLAQLRARVEASDVRHDTGLADVKKDVQKLWEQLLKSGGEGADVPAAGERSPAFEAAVRDVLDRYAMEHKFREAVQKAQAPIVPKKPSFVQLATALKLRPEQAERFGNEIRAIQTELYEILSVPRSDGVAPLEEIQMAEQYPEGNPKRAEIFVKLFKLTIPDTQETYVERAVSLATKVKSGTRDYFDKDQSALLDTLDLDWFGIRMQ